MAEIRNYVDGHPAIPTTDIRRRKRGFDFEAYDAEMKWQPDPSKPDEKSPFVTREEERLKAIRAAEKILGREIMPIPVGLGKQAIEALEMSQAATEQMQDITYIQDYAQSRDTSRAA